MRLISWTLQSGSEHSPCLRNKTAHTCRIHESSLTLNLHELKTKIENVLGMLRWALFAKPVETKRSYQTVLLRLYNWDYPSCRLLYHRVQNIALWAYLCYHPGTFGMRKNVTGTRYHYHNLMFCHIITIDCSIAKASNRIKSTTVEVIYSWTKD
jgi:hypothetical protein